jgi:hypothetical protein
MAQTQLLFSIKEAVEMLGDPAQAALSGSDRKAPPDPAGGYLLARSSADG